MSRTTLLSQGLHRANALDHDELHAMLWAPANIIAASTQKQNDFTMKIYRAFCERKCIILCEQN